MKRSDLVLLLKHSMIELFSFNILNFLYGNELGYKLFTLYKKFTVTICETVAGK